jgi:hypothetical protein
VASWFVVALSALLATTNNKNNRGSYHPTPTKISWLTKSISGHTPQSKSQAGILPTAVRLPMEFLLSLPISLNGNIRVMSYCIYTFRLHLVISAALFLPLYTSQRKFIEVLKTTSWSVLAILTRISNNNKREIFTLLFTILACLKKAGG